MFGNIDMLWMWTGRYNHVITAITENSPPKINSHYEPDLGNKYYPVAVVKKALDPCGTVKLFKIIHMLLKAGRSQSINFVLSLQN